MSNFKSGFHKTAGLGLTPMRRALLTGGVLKRTGLRNPKKVEPFLKAVEKQTSGPRDLVSQTNQLLLRGRPLVQKGRLTRSTARGTQKHNKEVIDRVTGQGAFKKET